MAAVLRPGGVVIAHEPSDQLAHLDAELQAMKVRDDVQWVSSPMMYEWIAQKRA